MKGDFSRPTRELDATKVNLFAGVLHQQGRVWLDSDWNADVYDRLHLLQQETIDIIGKCGAPDPGTGFKISKNPDPTKQDDFQIAAGRYYVDGILCQLANDVSYLTQPDYPAAPHISMPTQGNDLQALIYLEVWQRLITYIEDPLLREIALGGPDTSTRIKTVAQVKVLTVPHGSTKLTCDNAPLPTAGRGTLTTLQPTNIQPDDLCRLPDPANYTGRENHLYRVEIHDGGDVLGGGAGFAFNNQPLSQDAPADSQTLVLQKALSSDQVGALTRSGLVTVTDNSGQIETVTVASIDNTNTTLTLASALVGSYTVANNASVSGGVARFKWSRDNASFAVAVTLIGGDSQTLTLASLGRDRATALRQGDIVEISDDASDLGPARGFLTYLKAEPDLDLFTVTLASKLPMEFQVDRHLKLHRWDGVGWANTTFDPAATPDMDLGDGVHIQFGGSDLRPGDYWQFAARSIDGSVERLTDADPMGIKRHYCPLAIVKWTKQYQFDRQKLIETLTSRQFGNQAISRLENILREQYGESNQIIADISEFLSTAQHADLSDTQRQKLHESLLQVKPQVTFKVLEDCRSQFPALTELTSLFYVSGDGQETMPDLTHPGNLFSLAKPLCVGVANGNKPVEGAIVRFQIISGSGKLQNGSDSANILTGSDGIACCGWQLDSTTPSQQVEAHLLDDAGNTMHLPVRFTANLSIAAEVAYDPRDCSNLQGAKTVQQAIDQLCRMERSSGCEVTVGKGGQFARLEDAIKKLRETKQTSWCICLLPGEYILPDHLELGGEEVEEVHIHITACSPGTLVRLQGPLDAGGLASISLSGFTIDAKNVEYVAKFKGYKGELPSLSVTFNDLTITVADVERSEDAISFLGCSSVTLRNVAVMASGMTQIFNFEECRTVILTTCQLVGTEDVGTILSIGAGARHINLDGNVLSASRVALIIADGNADTTLVNNNIRGIISLYGKTEKEQVLENMREVWGKLQQQPDLLQAATGIFQARGNRLTRLVVADEKIGQIGQIPYDRPVAGLYKAFLLTDNVIEEGGNVFVAVQVSVMSTFFAQEGAGAVRRYVGHVISQATTLIGNHAPNIMLLVDDVSAWCLGDMSPRHQYAANLLDIQIF